MRCKIRYRPKYIERSECGYPLAALGSPDGNPYSDDCSGCIWFSFKFKRYWCLEKFDGQLSFVILRCRHYLMYREWHRKWYGTLWLYLTKYY